MTVTGRGQDPIFKYVNSKSLKVGNWLNEQCQLFFRHRHHQDNTSFSGLGIRIFHLSNVQNPYDIPLYWMVHCWDPYK